MALPPPQPAYIFRGHASTVHSLHFTRNNSRLISGDADGWVVSWSTSTKRAQAVWRAHNATILAIDSYDDESLITQGRDGKIYVWQLREQDEDSLSKQLPVEQTLSSRPHPWLLHSLSVSSLTFCAFTICSVPNTSQFSAGHLVVAPGNAESDSVIHITHVESERLQGQIPTPAVSTGKSGMIMALGAYFSLQNEFFVIAGYESGRTYVFKHLSGRETFETVYTARPHDQPILSLVVMPGAESYLTSSADAVIAKHQLRNLALDLSQEASKIVQTGHAGQQGLKVRCDGKIFATAGWDGRSRVYSCKTMKELAVLKWHKEGCYALAFASIENGTNTQDILSTDINPPNIQDLVVVSEQQAISKPTVKQLRNTKAQKTHWLALGSKDGKISLWDIY